MGNQPKEIPKPQESPSDKMIEMIFDFKTMAREFNKCCMKCKNEEKSVKLKVKQAIEKNDMSSAKMFAADAIRKQNEARRYQNLSFKMDAIHSRLRNAYQTQKVKKILLFLVDRKYEKFNRENE